MTEAVLQRGAGVGAFPATALKAAGVFWFAVAVLGQWAFAAYIMARYAPSLDGDFTRWERHGGLIDGYIAGDLAGNLTFLAHVLLAGVLTLGGSLQLFPQIRKHMIGLHRWNGRLFMLTALLATTGGLYLVWVRGTGNGVFAREPITANSILIFAFITLAFVAIRRKNIASHQRWAMRAYLAVNGVWFLRIALMATGIITRNEDMTENLFGFWSWASFLLPLAVYEAYVFARERGGAFTQLSMAMTLAALTLVMGVGLAGLVGLAWLPHLA